jgi:hypothetical protein
VAALVLASIVVSPAGRGPLPLPTTAPGTVRAAISWSSRGLMLWRRYDPASGPHPYHGPEAKRCATPRSPRSRGSVGAAVMGPPSASTSGDSEVALPCDFTA